MVIWIDRQSFRQLSPLALKVLAYVIAEREDDGHGWTLEEIVAGTGLLPLEMSRALCELTSAEKPYGGGPYVHTIKKDGVPVKVIPSYGVPMWIDGVAGKADLRYEAAPEVSDEEDLRYQPVN